MKISTKAWNEMDYADRYMAIHRAFVRSQNKKPVAPTTGQGK
ncbi:hypothetical protein ABFV99_14590 [Cytobacillus horneckiae]